LWAPSCRNIHSEEWESFARDAECAQIWDPELEAAISEYWDVKAVYDEAEALYEDVKDKIRIKMGALGWQRRRSESWDG